MMVITAGRDERRLAAIALDQFEAEDPAIECERPLDVGDLEMNVTDTGLSGNRLCFRTSLMTYCN